LSGWLLAKSGDDIEKGVSLRSVRVALPDFCWTITVT
jgi:hypothetical protein